VSDHSASNPIKHNQPITHAHCQNQRHTMIIFTDVIYHSDRIFWLSSDLMCNDYVSNLIRPNQGLIDLRNAKMLEQKHYISKAMMPSDSHKNSESCNIKDHSILCKTDVRISNTSDTPNADTKMVSQHDYISWSLMPSCSAKNSEYTDIKDQSILCETEVGIAIDHFAKADWAKITWITCLHNKSDDAIGFLSKFRP
jgi:hypothetical protein